MSHPYPPQRPLQLLYVGAIRFVYTGGGSPPVPSRDDSKPDEDAGYYQFLPATTAVGLRLYDVDGVPRVLVFRRPFPRNDEYPMSVVSLVGRNALGGANPDSVQPLRDEDARWLLGLRPDRAIHTPTLLDLSEQALIQAMSGGLE